MKWENFTAARVAGFKCAPGKTQSIFWDGKTPGLGLRVTAAGTKSYIFETSLHGKTLRITIGDIATYSVSAAQQEADAYKAQTNMGIDPRQVRTDARDAKQAAEMVKAQTQAIEQAKRELIARDAWDAYLAAPRPKTGKKSWGDRHRADHADAASPGGESCKIGDKNAKPAPLSTLLAMPLHSITAQTVADWLVLECSSRPTFAHNCFRKFRTFIGWCEKQPDYMAVVQADCCVADVVKDIMPASKTKEGDCLQREQLYEWFTAVRKIENPVIAAYLQALLITGARRGELELLM